MGTFVTLREPEVWKTVGGNLAVPGGAVERKEGTGNGLEDTSIWRGV